jgi:hypothetical protein
MPLANSKSFTNIARLIAAGAIAVACGQQAFAQDTPVSAAPYGRSAQADSAGKTVSLTEATRWVNVEDGDVVTFVHGDKTFTWRFDTLRGAQQFPLAAIAPADSLAAHIVVYVADN